jgi:hypothetical protein
MVGRRPADRTSPDRVGFQTVSALRTGGQRC